MFILIAVFLVALSNLALGLIVLLKNRGNFINTSFGIFAFIMSVWLVADFYSNSVFLAILSYRFSLNLNRITFFLSGMGLYFLWLFAMEFTRLGYKYFRPLAISVGLFCLGASILSTTSLVLKGILPGKDGVILRTGPLIWPFMAFIVGLILAIIVTFAISIPRLKGPSRVRTKIMTASLFLSLSIAAATNLILPVVFQNYRYITLGLLSTSIIVVGFTYAIVRHRLFDIRIIVTRSIAYLLLLITLAASYAFVSFRIGGMIFKNSVVSTPQQTFNVITALVLALTIQPLKHLFEKMTDKIFYRDRYDPQVLMNEVSNILASEIGLMEMSRKVRDVLVQKMRIERVDLIVLDGNRVFVETGPYVVSKLEDLVKDLGILRGQVLVTDEQPEGQAKEILQAYGISVLAVLRTPEDKAGYLLFGGKSNGDIYTNNDLKVIPIIADQLAVAIQNAKAYLQIQQFNKTLQIKIDDATKQLKDANASLKQLDHLKDEFISMASHQLRTPMTVVDGYVANIIDGLYGPTNDRQKQALELVENRIQLTAGLVADLLDLSRIEAGRFFINRTPVDLSRVVPEEVEQLKMKAQELDTALVYQPTAETIPVVDIDEQKTRQVIMNLIDNALAYTPKGKVVVTLETAGNQIIFKVIDNGIGVPEEEQPKLFHKFFRADNAKVARRDGTGIGLYLVKRVIEEQGGTLIFQSKLNEGSTFGFRMPIQALVAPKQPHSNSSSSATKISVAHVS